MFNKILWTIDNECDGRTFERLCTDLMYREGYTDIIPIGGNYDNGRDAEIRKLKGINETSELIFFQYSLEKNWLNKIEREIEKTFSKHHNINHYVFVSSSKITGKKRDELREDVFKKYNCNLIIYDREWLRTRLEIGSADLAGKYFKISTEEYEIENYEIEITIPQDQKEELAWKYYNIKNYEPAIFAFKDLLLTNPNHPEILLALSWSLYLTLRYDEAIYYINKAVDVIGYNNNTMAIKACILAEYGIKKNSKEYLLIAKEIFIKLAKDINRAIDHYNLGNTLSALGEFNEARKEYLLSIKKNLKSAETWKNLGSVYDHLGNHSEELKCYNKALELNPSLPQGLISKAITLLKHHNEHKQALKLLDKALTVDDKIYFKWPLIYYWYSEALYRINKPKEALRKIDEGLNHTPDNVYMLNLKSSLLSNLWVKDDYYIDQAIVFYKNILKVFINDKETIIELCRIYKRINDKENYWLLVENYFKLEKINLIELFKEGEMGNYIENSIRYYEMYKEFRSTLPINSYIDIKEFKKFNKKTELKELLFICYLLSFSFLCNYFITRFVRNEKKHSNITIKNEILTRFKLIFKVLSNFYSKNANVENIKDKIEIFSFNIAHWPIYSAMELSHQLGFVMGYLKLPRSKIIYLSNGLFKKEKLNQRLMLLNLENFKKDYNLLQKEYSKSKKI